MDEVALKKTIEISEREITRTHILSVANSVHPRGVSKPVLLRSLELLAIEGSDHDLESHVHYLAEKKLLRIEPMKSRAQWKIQISAHEIAFLEGRVEEQGLAAPNLTG